MLHCRIEFSVEKFGRMALVGIKIGTSMLWFFLQGFSTKSGTSLSFYKQFIMFRFSKLLLKHSSFLWLVQSVDLHKLNRPWSAQAQNSHKFSPLVAIFLGGEVWKFAYCTIFPSCWFILFWSLFCWITDWKIFQEKIIDNWQLAPNFYWQIMFWSHLTNN